VGRPREHHIQLSLDKVVRVPDKNGQWRGGARTGAGRKRAPGPRRMTHTRRPYIQAANPMLVTLRVEKVVGSLRRMSAYRAIRRALKTVAYHHGIFRIVHFSLQRDHIHLLVEADGKFCLSRGMRSFQIAAAKHLNRELTPKGKRRRRGRVFVDRYHVMEIDSVARVCNAVSYVLNNWRKHGQNRETRGLFGGRIDPYSSGVYFLRWKERTNEDVVIPAGYEPPEIGNAHTWLLTAGLARGRPISVWDVPGARP
jgi:REP element-mobilizing transposase RayT